MSLRFTCRAFTAGICAFLLPTQSTTAQSNSDELRLAQITERSWQHKLKTNIDIRLRLNQPIDQLPDLSYDGLLQEIHLAHEMRNEPCKRGLKPLPHLPFSYKHG